MPSCRPPAWSWTTPRTVTGAARWVAEPGGHSRYNARLSVFRESLVEKLKGALAVGFLRLFALLPWRAVQAVGSAIGWLMWKLPNGSREVVRINLAKCFPELSEAERERLVGRTLRDIGRTLTESACAWIWPVQRTLGL